MSIIDRRVSQQDLSWFLDLNTHKKLNLNPPYQRKSVWTSKDKQFFLDTVFNNYPCPAVYIQKETGQDFVTRYNVVDGKQRLNTVIDFYNNKIKLSESFGDDRLNNKKWSEIEDNVLKTKFLNYSFTVETLDSIDPTGWNIVFDRLNRNAKTLSNQELRHARFDGWLINRAEQEAENPFWKQIKISSTSKARRMKDVEFISILMLVILEGKIVGFPQSALDKLYAKYETLDTSATEEDFFDDKSFDSDMLIPGHPSEDQLSFDELITSYESPADNEDDFEEKFTEIKNFISLFNAKSELITDSKVFGARRTSHIYSLWSYLALVKIPSDPEVFKSKYEDLFVFFEQLQQAEMSEWPNLNIPQPQKDLVIKYLNNSTGASTEEPQRKGRLEALQEFLES
jgi:hypothetical protein